MKTDTIYDKGPPSGAVYIFKDGLSEQIKIGIGSDKGLPSVTVYIFKDFPLRTNEDGHGV